MKLLAYIVAVGCWTSVVGAAEFRLNGRTLTLPDGFTLEVAADATLAKYPIFADFDERGRLYVGEASGVADWQDEQPVDQPQNWHRMLQLTDADGDGRFDQRRVFATFPRPPHGSLWLDGSLYVASPPIIWKLTDADDDGVAEHQEKWVEQVELTGCLNDFHGPFLGPDGWLYWTKGGGAKQTYAYRGKPWSTTASHVYRKRPNGDDVEQVMVGGMDNPVEVAFSRGGERFVTSTFIHLPAAPRKDGILHAVYGGVHPKVTSSVFEFPWTGPDMMTEAAGWSAMAPAGLMRYASRELGKDYQDNLFSALFNGHSVRRQIFTQHGATYKNAEEDFLRSDDVQFHPTDVLEDADGSLLVIETGGWYRHCCPSATFFRPDVHGAIYRIRREGAHQIDDPRGLQLDWNGLSSEELTQLLADPRTFVADRAVRQLGSMGPAATSALSQVMTDAASARTRTNAVWAATRIDSAAARQVVRIGLTDADETVRQAALNSVSLSRDADAAAQLIKILAADSLHNRRAAAEALGRIGAASAAPALLEGLRAPVDRVLEHSIIFALIEIGDVAATRAALDSDNVLLRRAAMIALDQTPAGQLNPKRVVAEFDASEERMQEAAWWIASRHPQQYGEMVADWLRRRIHKPQLTDAERKTLAQRLSQAVGSGDLAEWISRELTRQGVAAETQILLLQAMSNAGAHSASSGWVNAVLDLLEAQHDSKSIAEVAIAALANLSPLPQASAAEQELALRRDSRLRLLAAREDLSNETRLTALAAARRPLAESDDELFAFLLAKIGPDEPFRVRTAAAEVLGNSTLNEQQLARLAGRMKHLAAAELKQVLGLFANVSSDLVGHRLVASLTASSSASNLQAFRLQHVLANFGPQIQSEAEPLFERLRRSQADALARADRVADLLDQTDLQRGLAVFQSTTAACASCHTTAYVGGTTGPHLRGLGQRRSERDLIESVLFPSASLAQGYQTWTVQTNDGRTLSGVLQQDLPDEIVLAGGPDKTHRLARTNIAEMAPSDVSTMPAGIDKTLTDQQLADLIAYLKSL